jgi:Ca-activated chloride channel family protein
VSFLFPAGFALSALAIPLVALYFLRLRRRKVRVSSLLPWHALQKSEKLASPFHKFRRNLLLLVQLLLLALLVLAFTRPFFESEEGSFQSVVLLIDTTASMTSRDGSARDASPTRFQRAVAEAERIVDALASTDEVMLVSSGPRTDVVVPFTRDHGVVERALGQLEVTEAEGGLEEGLRLALSLARSRPEVEVVVLSDGGPRDLTSVGPIGNAQLRFVRVGEGDQNAGIVALDLRRSPVSELEQQLFVTVRSFGTQSVSGSLEVYLEGDLVGLKTEELPPEVPVSMVFDLPPGKTGLLKVHLDSKPDLMPADDTAWAVVGDVASRRVLLVGGDALLARILAHDPRVRASHISASAVTPELLAQHDAVLFAGAVPDGVDGLDYAVLGPWPGSPVTFGGQVDGPRLTGWQRTHPTLRFVRWDDVIIGRAQQVADRGGLATIVDGEHGPLVLAGQRAGGRVVQLAFDPLQSDLPLRVAWPIFVMNIVGFLTEDPNGGGQTSHPTGAPFVAPIPSDLPADTAARVSGPASVEAIVSEGTVRVPHPDRVGVYDVAVGGTHLRFAANLLSASESRIRPRSALFDSDTLAGGAVAVEASAAMSRRDLWRPLLLAAMGLIVLEWLLWNLRRVA